MNSSVRTWIQLEINDKLSFSPKDFYETYYYFSQLIEYEVEKKGLSGLTERLTFALSFISSQKMDRQDIITYFPVIWGSFEIFTKKILYLIDPKTYNKLSKNPNSSLFNYLNELGFPVNITDSSLRTPESDIIYDSYKLRNIEAHEYNKWSLSEFYAKLNICLCGYMLVTRQVLQSLKTAFNKMSNFVQPQFNDFNILLFLNIMSFYDLEINRLHGLKKITSFHGKNMSFLEFDKEGKVLFSTYSPANGTPLSTEYTYTKKDNKLIATSDRDYRVYSYNNDGQIISEILYTKKGNSQHFIKCGENEIQYLEDGKVLIVNRKIVTNDKNELYCLAEQQFTYDSNGNLLHIQHSDNTFKKYIYNNHQLISFKSSSQRQTDVKYLDEEVFFIYKEELLEGTNEIIEKHFHYENGILKYLKHYAPTPDGKDTHITLERHFEYY